MRYYKIDSKRLLKIDDNNTKIKICYKFDPFEISEIGETSPEPGKGFRAVTKENKNPWNEHFNVSEMEQLSYEAAEKFLKTAIRDEANKLVASCEQRKSKNISALKLIDKTSVTYKEYFLLQLNRQVRSYVGKTDEDKYFIVDIDSLTNISEKLLNEDYICKLKKISKIEFLDGLKREEKRFYESQINRDEEKIKKIQKIKEMALSLDFSYVLE